MHATETMQPTSVQPPFATWNPTRGCWETSQRDLFGRTEPFSGIWPTSGEVQGGSAYRRHWPAHRITGSVSSSPPTARTLFRTPLASDSSRGGETLDQVRARRGTIALSHQLIDLALHGPHGSPASWNESETLFALVEDIFTAGGDTPIHCWGRYAEAIARWEHITERVAPAPAILNEEKGPRPAPEFVEWLMGLPAGWVTDPEHGMTAAQQNTALGNGVLPLQAVVALDALQAGTEPR